MTAFPESTPFKLTIWNILGGLEKEKKKGGGGCVPRSSLLQPLGKKKQPSVRLLKGQSGPMEKVVELLVRSMSMTYCNI